VSTTTLIEAIKDDLGYLKLHRAVEVFASLADGDRDRRDDRLQYLAAIVAEHAAATRANDGSTPGCASPTSRPDAPSRSSTSTSNLPSTAPSSPIWPAWTS
jgi:hypothetical protein